MKGSKSHFKFAMVLEDKEESNREKLKYLERIKEEERNKRRESNIKRDLSRLQNMKS